MITITDKKNCCGCHACVNTCPVQAISMTRDAEGFLYPQVDKTKCIECGLCEKICPCLHPQGSKERLTAYAAFSKDTPTRLESSSGGIFSVLAQNILKKGGAVAGAVMDENMRGVHHIIVEHPDDLAKLRGSKYLQSKIGDIYTQSKKILDEGRPLFFTGTPCQILGLKNYLGRDYPKLISMDLICHGVPSDAVWHKYLLEQENQRQGSIDSAQFRYKQSKIAQFGQDKHNTNNSLFIPKKDDKFMQIFLQDWCLRPSCYNCMAKLKGYASDLTIGDFWGVSEEMPKMNDETGTSAMIIRTAKGLQLWQKILPEIQAKEVDYAKIFNHNRALEIPVAAPEKRQEFMQDLQRMSFNELHNKYFDKTKILKTMTAKKDGQPIDNCSYGMLLTFKN